MAKGSGFVRIYNKSHQTVSIQARPPGGDFFIHEQQIHIPPGKDATLPRDHLLLDQVTNLAARGLVRLIQKDDD